MGGWGWGHGPASPSAVHPTEAEGRQRWQEAQIPTRRPRTQQGPVVRADDQISDSGSQTPRQRWLVDAKYPGSPSSLATEPGHSWKLCFLSPCGLGWLHNR